MEKLQADPVDWVGTPPEEELEVEVDVVEQHESNVLDEAEQAPPDLAETWGSDAEAVLHCYCQCKEIDPLTMVQCEGCSLYFHQDCFRQGRCTSLLGDKFIEFFCENCGSVCDDGRPEAREDGGNERRERISRKPHTWVTAVSLALFNLHLTHADESRKGYFQWREQVCRYIEDRWKEFFSDRKKAPKWQGAVACTLSTNTGILFQSGLADVDEQGWWKLIENVPPDPKNPISNRSGSRKRRGLLEDASAVVDLGPRVRKRPTLAGGVEGGGSVNRDSPKPRRRSWTKAGDVEQVVKTEKTWVAEDVEVAFDDQSEQESSCRSTLDTKEEPPEVLQGAEGPRGVGDVVESRRHTRVVPMSLSKEKQLLEALQGLAMQGRPLSARELRLLTKLRVRQRKRERGIPVFDLDAEVSRLSTTSRDKGGAMHEMYDRFVHTDVIRGTPYEGGGRPLTFAVRLLGEGTSIYRQSFRSPYTQRLLKPYIFRDASPDYPRVRLMQEIHAHPLAAVHAGAEDEPASPYRVLSVDLVYIRPEHVAVINSICRSFFWANIDLTDQLSFPEFSVVALYGKLVIGFACMAPMADSNEAYLSFLWTHPHFRRRGLARLMLYHLSQSCMGRDIVLHVGVTNPAVFLYQSFKFRVEKICLDFYDKYIQTPAVRRPGSKCRAVVDSGHALYMRLKW